MEWRKETEMSMRDYEQQLLLRELGSETPGWFRDTIDVPDTETLDEAIEELAHDDGDTYEVVARIHLVNGQVIELHNRCFDSVTKVGYCSEGMCDEIYVYANNGFSVACRMKDDEIEHTIFYPLVELQYFDKEGNFHISKIPISAVCYIDNYVIHLDWKSLWAELPNDEKDRRRERWLEYRKREKEREERNKNKD